MCRFVTCAKDVRVFPMSGRRDGIGFIVLLFGVGALMALVDRRRRALQDVAARSAVVYDWGDRPAALPAPLTQYLDRKALSSPIGSEKSAVSES